MKLLKKMGWIDYRDRVDLTEISLDVTVVLTLAGVIFYLTTYL